ncbi:MAG TPA: hypothetical protein VGE51_14885 [Fontimonas sp.]
MNPCEACKQLAKMPHRSDVPQHLKLYMARALSFGFVRVTTYECVHCERLWRWRVTDGWSEADFPVAPIAAPIVAPSIPAAMNQHFA